MIFMILNIDSFLLTDADYAICLDALAGGSELFLHVSKPPKEGTKAHELVNHLNQVRLHSPIHSNLIASSCSPLTFSMTQKSLLTTKKFVLVMKV